MKRGKNNKAALINRSIKQMEIFASKKPDDNPLGIFWKKKVEKFKSLRPSKLKKIYLQAFLEAVTILPLANNVYHEEETNESKFN